jgi:flagellar hook-length control protein FliK
MSGQTSIAEPQAASGSQPTAALPLAPAGSLLIAPAPAVIAAPAAAAAALVPEEPAAWQVPPGPSMNVPSSTQPVAAEAHEAVSLGTADATRTRPGAGGEAIKPPPAAMAIQDHVGTQAAAASADGAAEESTPLPVATPRTAAQTLAAVKMEFDRPLTPLAAEVAAIAAAQGAGNQPGASSDTSRDDRGHQPRPSSAEPVSAIAHRLAQTVQLMAGFEHVLETVTQERTSAPELPNEPQLMATLVKSMRLQHQSGGGTAVIKLDPEFLGGVTVSLQLTRGAVTASLQAERADVRAWLEANEGTLRDALKQQGLSLDRLVVSDDRLERQRETSSDGRRRESQPAPARKPRRQGSGEAVTFEVVV